MKPAEIGSTTKVTIGLLVSLCAGIGALGSAIVSYAVTSATLEAEAGHTKARLDYSELTRDKMAEDIVSIKVDVAEIKGIVSELKESKTARK